MEVQNACLSASLNVWAPVSDWPPKCGQGSSQECLAISIPARQSVPSPPTSVTSQSQEALPSPWAKPSSNTKLKAPGMVQTHFLPLTSRAGYSDLDLVFLQNLLWEFFFSLFGRNGAGGEGFKMSAWWLTDMIAEATTLRKTQGCFHNLPGWWPILHQSFSYPVTGKGGTQATFRMMGRKWQLFNCWTFSEKYCIWQN